MYELKYKKRLLLSKSLKSGHSKRSFDQFETTGLVYVNLFLKVNYALKYISEKEKKFEQSYDQTSGMIRLIVYLIHLVQTSN